MRRDSVIFLLARGTGENDIGDAMATLVPREIFATKKSVRQSEFYQAAATDLKPELTFVVWTLEYGGESQLEFDGKTYTIIRTFDVNEKETELICSGLVNGVG